MHRGGHAVTASLSDYEVLMKVRPEGRKLSSLEEALLNAQIDNCVFTIPALYVSSSFRARHESRMRAKTAIRGQSMPVILKKIMDIAENGRFVVRELKRIIRK